MIILYSTVNINYPSHNIAFFQGAVVFASMDIFSGESLYEQIFEFKETEPLNVNFELLDIDSKIFIMNSGSFFVILFGVIVYNFLLACIQVVTVKCAKHTKLRIFR